MLLLLVFELANVYFIMPMPGSQKMDSVKLAYFLFEWRWVFRSIFVVMIVVGVSQAPWKRVWIPPSVILIFGSAIYFLNFRMSADHIFRQPQQLVLADKMHNMVDTNRLVMGIVIDGIAKAYPIQFLGYHHLVYDTFGSRPVLLTYCTVCRTGRAFDPVINGRAEQFRLVGMDHFNAMMEDATTGSWWRQATGEAVTGKLAGKRLNEIYGNQVSLGEWLRLYPGTLIMQEDATCIGSYPKGFDYENGNSRNLLTGTDTSSWGDKSWVVGVLHGDSAKAYDWKVLRTRRIIDDHFVGRRIIIVLGQDNKSFFAYKVVEGKRVNIDQNDIVLGSHSYQMNGKGKDTSEVLERVAIYQEFWHSWRTFHPKTSIYRN